MNHNVFGVHSYDSRNCDKKMWVILTITHAILILKYSVSTRESIWFLEKWVTLVINLF